MYGKRADRVLKMEKENTTNGEFKGLFACPDTAITSHFLQQWIRPVDLGIIFV